MAKRGPAILGATTIVVLLFILLKLSLSPHSTPPQPHPLNEAGPDASAKLQESKAITTPIVPAPLAEGPHFIFAFGDSYTTYGFETNDTLPSQANPFGNRFPETDTSTPARRVRSTPKWVDFLIKDFSPPRTLAYNFARGASTIDPDVIPPHFWGAKALRDQEKELHELVAGLEDDPLKAWNGANSAVVIWLGINDVSNTADEELDHVGNAIVQNKDTPRETPEERDTRLKSLYLRTMESYIRTLEALYDAGARRFILLGLPPIDRTPSLIFMGPPHTFNVATASQLFNGTFYAEVGAWADSMPEAQVRLVDTEPIFHHVLDADPDDAQCSHAERDSCLWMDMFHPAAKLQKAVAGEIAEALGEMDMWKA